MADKNRNGIDDRYETGLQPINTAADALANYEKKNRLRPGSLVDPRAVGSGGYSAADSIEIARRRGRMPGFDKWVGGGALSGAKSALGSPEVPEPTLDDTDLPSFMSFLQQAMGMSGGPERISYDPQRADARRRGAEYDARIAAMYNQLANSMRDDGAGIQKNFQGAIDDTAARSAETQQAIQGASDSADARNMEVLRNLGIEDAQAGIIQGGRDLNTQAAGNVTEAAARGQIAGDALTQNQQAAGAHNANLVGAAGLEGNLQRARVQSELSSLLAQYDMQEQEANRQAQQQSLSQSMGLANALYEDAWRQQGYNDDMTRWLYEQQQAANQPAPVDPGQMGLNFIAQLQQRFPDLAMDDLLKMVQGVGTIGKLYG